MTNGWPAGVIDHINGHRSDNRFSNLRCVPVALNRQNTLYQASSASGLKGVVLHGKKYRATIQTSGVRQVLGRFDTAEEAHAAYLNARAALHSVPILYVNALAAPNPTAMDAAKKCVEIA